MLHFLLFIFLFVILIIVFGLLFVSRILRAIFHIGWHNGKARTSTGSSGEGDYMNTEQPQKQIFGDDEGEYVDFEEVKEDKDSSKVDESSH